jgi:hypothetical protein
VPAFGSGSSVSVIVIGVGSNSTSISSGSMTAANLAGPVLPEQLAQQRFVLDADLADAGSPASNAHRIDANGLTDHR